jgi:DNA mismatch repair ATPase MutS
MIKHEIPPRDAEFFVEAFEDLQQNSRKSVPDLSELAGRIAAILKNGEENASNITGVVQFQSVIDRLNKSAEKVRISSSQQKQHIERIISFLNMVESSLKLEVERTPAGTRLPLGMFTDIAEGTSFDLFMKGITAEIRALERLARPELQMPSIHIITEDSSSYYFTGPHITKSETYVLGEGSVCRGNSHAASPSRPR